MYWDTLIRIKNGLERGSLRVKAPYSKFDLAILELLVKEGYLEAVSRKGRGVKKIIEIKLKYDSDGKPAISEIKFISRPSRHLYLGFQDIKPSRQGYGNYILSTSIGILTGREAKRRKVGGEILFEIW